MIVYLEGKLEKMDLFIELCDDYILIYAISSMQADLKDKKKVHNLSEYINSINCEIWIGHFLMDTGDGEMLYKVYIDSRTAF